MTERPRYETQQDRDKESAAIAKIARMFRCKPVKCPEAYRADFALVKEGDVYTFAEVKVRSASYDPFWIALQKWMALEQLGHYTPTRSLIVVQWPGKLGYVDVLQQNRDRGVIWGGREDRDDWQDLEPLVCVPLKNFIEVP